MGSCAPARIKITSLFSSRLFYNLSALGEVLILSVLFILLAFAARESAAEGAEERTSAAQFPWASGVPTEMDVRAIAKREEAIRKLRELVPTVPEGPSKAEVIFRLAEMVRAKSRSLHGRAMRRWEADLEVWHAGGRRGPRPEIDADLVAQAEAVREEVLALYRQILDEYRHYARADEVLYSMGTTYDDAGDEERALASYRNLIDRFPGSSVVAGAWLRLGEHHYEARELTLAVECYSRATESSSPRMVAYALYKLAWCEYNLQHYERALDRFREVIAYTRSQPAQAMENRYRFQLLEESLADAVRVFSRLDASDAIDAAFTLYTEEVGRDQAYRYLRELARLVAGGGKLARAVEVYQRLNRAYPDRLEAPANHVAVIQALAALNRGAEVRRQLRQLINLYSPTGAWARANQGDPEALERALALVETHLAALAADKYREAQADNRADTLPLARDLYRGYLDLFREAADSCKTNFVYAEILMELTQYREAAREYDRVIAMEPQGELVEAAAYNAVLAWEKVVARAEGNPDQATVEKRTEQGLPQVEDLDEDEMALVAAFDRFARVAPDHVDAGRVRFKAAQLLLEHSQLAEATERFAEIVEERPGEELGRLAATAILRTWTDQKDWRLLHRWAREIHGNSALMADRHFARTLRAALEVAAFNEIREVLEPRSEPLETAGRYAAFVDEFPHSRYAMVALYNAVVAYDRANAREKALALAEQVLRRVDAGPEGLTAHARPGDVPPSSEIRAKTLFLAAGIYERGARLGEAAEHYERYAREVPQGPRRADALHDAGVLREGLGELDAALRNLRAYLRDYPRRPDVCDVEWRIGLIHERKNDYRAMQAVFTDIARDQRLSAARRLCAQHEVVQALEGQNRQRAARAGYQRILSVYDALPEIARNEACAQSAAAAAAFAAVEPMFASYLALTLANGQLRNQRDEAEMARRFRKKAEMVNRLRQGYSRVLEIGNGDYGIAALYRMGVVDQHLADAIVGSPCPRRLDRDQCSIYASALEARVVPFAESAQQAFEMALAKGYELGLYNEWLARAQQALAAIDPARFPPRRELGLFPSEEAFAALELVGLPASFDVDPAQLGLAETLLRGALDRGGDDDAGIHVNLGLIAFARGRHQLALVEMERAVALDPGHAVAHANIGGIALRFRDFSRARRSYGAAIEGGLLDCTTAAGLGYALEGERRPREALAQLSRAHEMCDDAELLYTMGLICWTQLHDKDCALEKLTGYTRERADLDGSHPALQLIRALEVDEGAPAAGPRPAGTGGPGVAASERGRVPADGKRR